MADKSQLEAYKDALNLYQEAQDDYDDPSHLKKFQAQRAVLETRFQNLLNVAELQDPETWHAIGNAFSTGRGTSRDKAEAIRWLQRAAEAGSAPAMVSLGLCLQYPEPALDQAAAIGWFRKAAEKGYASGMVWLGFAYREGRGVPRDYNEAVEWFTKAVDAGDSHSTVHVGRMYAHYLSSPAQAVNWFLRAAQDVHADSFLELARLYENRELEVYNPTEANKWFRVAVEYSEGHTVSALFALADQHLTGMGALCDVEMAKFWLNRILLVSPKTYRSHRQAAKMLKKLEGQFL
jgi:uncharacterized protein